MALPESEMFDAAIVGAGPAGACAAARIARHGLRVCIIEKDSLPRYKTCGGGILHRAVMRLQADISPVVEHQCHRIRLNISEGLSFEANRPDPVVSMVMRESFDHLLVQDAVNHGARLYQSIRVTGIESHPEYVRLKTSRGDLQARWVIAADGASSTVARLVNWPDGRLLVPAIECEIWGRPQDFPELYQAARFDFHAIGHGYAWSFPKREQLSIGVLTLRPQSVNLNDCLIKYLQRLGIPSSARMERHGYIIPLSPRKAPLAMGRILLVGDAAGLADPVTAEGISYAIISGQSAADIIAQSKSRAPDSVAADYNAWLNQHVIPELRAARRFARFLYHYPRIRKVAFRLQGERLVLAMTKIVMGETSYRDLGRFFV